MSDEGHNPEEDAIAADAQQYEIESRDARKRLFFEQDLNEVYLLIDFISGWSDRTLTSLKITDPGDDVEMSSGRIIKEIAGMRYPEPKEPPVEVINDRNAAILLLAKDQLSFMAKPAKGTTIAYTAMFIDADASMRWTLARLLPNWLCKILGLSLPPSDEERAKRDSRIDLAQRTFPGLHDHARKFASWRTGLIMFTLLWLILTLFTYWDTGLGHSALDRLDAAWKAQLDLVQKQPALLQCIKDDTLGPTPIPGQAAPPAQTASQPPKLPTDAEAKRDLDCKEYNYASWVSWRAGNEVKSIFECQGALRRLHIWCWHWLLPGTFNAITAGGPQPADNGARLLDYIKDNATYWQKATLILTTYSTFILPMMFALLGSIISSFRSILNRVRDSVLAPRDLMRMQLGVPLGLVAGVVVALFLSPSSIPMQGSGAISGQLALTASSLGFLAGYTSMRFFRFLDNVADIVMPESSTASISTNQQQAKGAPGL